MSMMPDYKNNIALIVQSDVSLLLQFSKNFD